MKDVIDYCHIEDCPICKTSLLPSDDPDQRYLKCQKCGVDVLDYVVHLNDYERAMKVVE